MTGNNSFLMVLKSSTGSTCGRLCKAASTKPCVELSRASTMMGKIWSLNSLPEQFCAAVCMFSSNTISPASRLVSFSTPFADLTRKISLSLGTTFSVNARLPLGIAFTIANTFVNMRASISLSFISSSRAGRTFFSRTDLGNWGIIRGRPRMNCAFSFGVLAGRASRNRMVETRMLSK